MPRPCSVLTASLGVLLALLIGAGPAAGHTWFGEPDMPAGFAQAAAVTWTDGTIYVFGGRTGAVGATSSTDAVWALDPCPGTWTARAPMPAATYGHRAALGTDGFIYVTGGAGLGGSMWRYDPAGNAWTVLPTATTATTGWQTAFVSDDTTGLLHRIGGRGDGD